MGDKDNNAAAKADLAMFLLKAALRVRSGAGELHELRIEEDGVSKVLGVFLTTDQDFINGLRSALQAGGWSTSQEEVVG